jgi:hypothetical protein
LGIDAGLTPLDTPSSRDFAGQAVVVIDIRLVVTTTDVA